VRRFALQAPRTVPAGTLLTLKGTNSPPGRIRGERRWNNEGWRVFASVPTHRGAYTIRIRATRRGRLKLRVRYPDRSVGVATIVVS